MPYDVEIENDVNVIAISLYIHIYNHLYIVTLSEFCHFVVPALLHHITCVSLA